MANTKISALTSASTPLAGSEVLPIVQGGATVKVSVDNLTAGKNMSTAVITNALAAGSTDSGLTNYVQYYNVGTPGTTANVVRFAGAVATDIYYGRVVNADAFGWGAVNGAEWMRLNSTGQTLNNGNWIQGTAAKGVNFTANTPAAGMTSQLLNWYEEGTWTPTVTFATPGDLSVTYNTGQRIGTYTRIGDRLYINFAVGTATFTYTTASGALQITGLPFTAKTAAGQNIGSMVWGGITKAGYTQVVPRVNSAASLVDFIASGSGVTQASVISTDVPTTSTVVLRGTLVYQL